MYNGVSEYGNRHDSQCTALKKNVAMPPPGGIKYRVWTLDQSR